MTDTIIRDKQSAIGYDEQARKTNWLGPQVVFGLAYEFVKPGDSLLDLGIGSGLSSVLFHKVGLNIYGLDGSAEVLEVCAAKGWAIDLKQHDLRDLPLPYPSARFNHVVCIAVLNSFQDLAPLLREIARIMQERGIFAFTVEDQKPGQEDSYDINRVEVAEQPKPESAVTLYRHGESRIREILAGQGLSLLRALEFVGFRYPAENRDVMFKAYVTQKD